MRSSSLSLDTSIDTLPITLESFVSHGAAKTARPLFTASSIAACGIDAICSGLISIIIHAALPSAACITISVRNSSVIFKPTPLIRITSPPTSHSLILTVCATFGHETPLSRPFSPLTSSKSLNVSSFNKSLTYIIFSFPFHNSYLNLHQESQIYILR